LPIDRPIPIFKRPKYFFYDEYKIEACIMSKYQGHFLPPPAYYKVLETEALLYLQELEKERENERQSAKNGNEYKR